MQTRAELRTSDSLRIRVTRIAAVGAVCSFAIFRVLDRHHVNITSTIDT
jgi:hypothetical protein